MKKLIIISIMLISNGLYAQDIITKRDGTTIRAKNINVSSEAITYKEYEELDGYEHLVQKNEVKKINYTDGKVIWFDDSTRYTISAQDDSVKPDSIESKMFNNALNGCVGSLWGGLWYTATVYYERMFQRNTQKSKISTFVKVGFGGASSEVGEIPYILSQFGILTGVKKNHLEVSAGLFKFLNEGAESFPLSGLIGYRRQKPGSPYIFRTGLGWPEAYYIGFGVSF